MSFSDLKFLQYVNAASAAVYRCSLSPDNSKVIANNNHPSELDIQTALTCISTLYTYMLDHNPTTFTNFSSYQYQNLSTYLNMSINRNGPTIIIGSNNTSPVYLTSIGTIANNYITNPIQTVGYFAQTSCVDFALPSNDKTYQTACQSNSANPYTCYFAQALSTFSNAYLATDMCNVAIATAMSNLSTALKGYNIALKEYTTCYNNSTPNSLLGLILAAVATAIIAFNSAVGSATDGLLVVLNTYLTTPVTVGTAGSLLTLSQALLANTDLNGLALALFELGEQNSTGGAFMGMIQNSLVNEYTDAGSKPPYLLGHCKDTQVKTIGAWYQHTNTCAGWNPNSSTQCGIQS